jgi:hypothetical protein
VSEASLPIDNGCPDCGSVSRWYFRCWQCRQSFDGCGKCRPGLCENCSDFSEACEND